MISIPCGALRVEVRRLIQPVALVLPRFTLGLATALPHKLYGR